MNVRVYLITFVYNQANVYDFEQYLKFDPAIKGFWNYIPLVYCVKSFGTAADLRSALHRFFPAGGFMVAEINPQNTDGILPKEAWDWFYTPPEPRTLGALAQSFAGPPK